MHNENIVCLAKDWTEAPTSNNHIMRILSHENDVLWLNSIAARSPNLMATSDVSRIARKLASFARGAEQAAPRLTIYTPIVLPFHHSQLATKINQTILKASVGLLRSRLGMRDFQLWAFIPTAAPYAGRFGESLLIYFCTDEWTGFDGVDPVKTAALEGALCRKADLVFTTSRTLFESKKAHNPNTHLASHGVDYAHFAAALDPGIRPADELAQYSRPVIGFFGLVESWIDVALFAYLADKRPSWTIMIVGEVKIDVGILKRYPNIVMTGRRPYAELPRYCCGWSVAVCPFVRSELTQHVNPIKLREYLSAGLPVVSTGLPEMLHHLDWCYIADAHADFLAACERAMAEDSPERRRLRSATMAGETWEAKVSAISVQVELAKERRRSQGVRASSS